jgi:hypothetical protein
MRSPQLYSGFLNIDTARFEDEMEQLQQLMLKNGLNKGLGQVTSRYKHLTGFQCQPKGNENEKQISDYIKNLLHFVSGITGWSVPATRLNIDHLTLLKGTRRSGNISQMLNGKSLDDFLLSNNVFSYVFPFRDKINFTSDIL